MLKRSKTAVLKTIRFVHTQGSQIFVAQFLQSRTHSTAVGLLKEIFWCTMFSLLVESAERALGKELCVKLLGFVFDQSLLRPCRRRTSQRCCTSFFCFHSRWAQGFSEIFREVAWLFDIVAVLYEKGSCLV